MLRWLAPVVQRAAMLGLVATAVFVATACSRTPRYKAYAGDAGTAFPDVSAGRFVDTAPTSSDTTVDRNIGPDSRLDGAGMVADVANFVPDSASDRAVPPAASDGSANGDGNRDSRITAEDAGGDVKRDAGVDRGEQVACTGTLMLGGLPMAQVSGYDDESISIADLNGDGKLDIVAAGRGVSVLLGRGDGRLASRTDYAAADFPAALVLGDLNGDGWPDIATANDDSNTVSVFLGNGDGTFAANVDYVIGELPRSLVMGDLNNDGKPDLVTVNNNSRTVSVLLGQGDGTLAPRLDYAPKGAPRSLALGDVNEDGKLDMVLATDSDPLTLSVALGKGDGTFATSTDLPFQSNLGLDGAPIALGDVNGDGKLDIVVTVAYTGEIGVLLGKGDGTFPPPVRSIATGGGSAGILLRDLNHDGKLDLVTAGRGVRVALGEGDGSFAAQVIYPYSARLLALAADDVNGDGNPDLAVALNDGSRDWVDLLFGNGDGTLAHNEALTYNTSSRPDSVTAADLNGDGNLDLVTTSASSVGVLFGAGNGVLSARTDYSTGQITRSTRLGDVNGDATIDIIAVDGASSTVGLLLGKGDGTFAPKVDYPTDRGPGGLALGDLDRDGVMDVVTSNGGSSVSGTVSVLLGTGDGKLAAHVDYPVGVAPVAVALGDLNGDRKPDIAVANAGFDGEWSVGVLLGKGDGTFAPETEYASGYGPNSIALGDLNGDGTLDIVTANSMAASSVSVLLGSGDGVFATNVDYVAGERPHSLVLGDVNGDGRLDAVTANPDSGTISLLLGKGDGTFASAIDYAFDARAVALGDFDGDGRIDLVTDTAVLLNTCK